MNSYFVLDITTLVSMVYLIGDMNSYIYMNSYYRLDICHETRNMNSYVI